MENVHRPEATAGNRAAFADEPPPPPTADGLLRQRVPEEVARVLRQESARVDFGPRGPLDLARSSSNIKRAFGDAGLDYANERARAEAELPEALARWEARYGGGGDEGSDPAAGEATATAASADEARDQAEGDSGEEGGAGSDSDELPPLPDELRRARALGLALIPLRPREKRPRDSGWTRRDYSDAEVARWAADGGNVGARLSDELLVVDVDPRNDPDGRSADGILRDLERELGVDLRAAPTVETGSGGLHVFLKKPRDLRTRNGAERLGPAVEFKSGAGRQVVAAGSTHPSGGEYRWLRNSAGPVPDAPGALLGAISGEATRSLATPAGEADPGDLAQVCAALGLDPETFEPGHGEGPFDGGFIENADRDDWIAVGQALHSRGWEQGLAVWIGWSRGQGYAAFDADENEYRWSTFRSDGERGLGTLFDLAKRAGFDLRGAGVRAAAREDFAGVPPDGEATSVLEQIVDEMNRTYAVAWTGGKLVVLREFHDVEWGRPDVTFTTPPDVRLAFANQRVSWVDRQRRRTEHGTRFDYWVRSPRRRSYDQIVFAPGGEAPPGCYNLWRGLAVDPDPRGRSGCALFLSHARDVLCGRDDDHFGWLLQWWADAVQNPGDRPGTAIVFRSDAEGAGKGVAMSYVGEIFGPHYLELIGAAALTRKFNAHLKHALLVGGDEVVFGDDKQGAGRLRSIITEPRVMIEPKGVDAFTVRNHMRLMLATNAEWVAPMQKTSRRFFIPTVSEGRVGDVEYFSALEAERKAGGPACLLRVLLDTGITENLRRAPGTEELLEQKKQSLDPIDTWWLQVLQEGKIPLLSPRDALWPDDCEGRWNRVRSVTVSRMSVLEAARSWFRDNRHAVPTPERFWNRLSKLSSDVAGSRANNLKATFGDSRGRAVEFGSLARARADFEKVIQQTVDWGDDGDESEGGDGETRPKRRHHLLD